MSYNKINCGSFPSDPLSGGVSDNGAVDGDWPRFNPLWGSLDNTPRRHTYYLDVEPSAMPTGSHPDIDDLRATLLRIMTYNTLLIQPGSVAEHVLVERATRRGTAPATVRDVLATLVDGGHLEQIDGEQEPHYRLVGSDADTLVAPMKEPRH